MTNEHPMIKEIEMDIGYATRSKNQAYNSKGMIIDALEKKCWEEPLTQTRERSKSSMRKIEEPSVARVRKSPKEEWRSVKNPVSNPLNSTQPKRGPTRSVTRVVL